MESAAIETLMPVKINGAAVAFPLHRRFPLKSKTLEIFARILSLYDDNSQFDGDHQIVSEIPRTGDQCKGQEVTTNCEGPRDGSLLSENEIGSSDVQNEAANSSEIFHELEHMVGVEENGELQFDPSTKEKYLTIVNELGNSIFPEFDQGAEALMEDMFDESKDGNSCSEMNLGDHFEHETRQVEIDTIVDSSLLPLDRKETKEGEFFGGGLISQSDDLFLIDSLAVEERNAGGAAAERERQPMEMDFVENHTSCPLDNQETEEGEIIDAGINSESGYVFLEDPHVAKEKKTDEEQIPRNHCRQEVFEERFYGKKAGDNDVASMPNLVETIDSVSKCTKEQVEFRKSGGMERKGNTESGSKTRNVKEPSGGVDVKKVNGFNGSSDLLLDDPIASSHSGKLEAAMENKKSISTEKVKAGEKKKRSDTPGRKKRKKEREKKKRAEKNRQLGVKRLKLQPITKPKPVRYCDFYVHGRCRQGNSCKFSHDTTPLTKSQPCKFLATNSCLKGDDCPFDHQLSKYACDRYKSDGFCNRGDKCLFSHEIASIENSNLASTSGQKEPGASSLQPCMEARRTMHNNLSSKTLKTVKETSGKTPVAEAGLKTAVQTAKATDIMGKWKPNNGGQSLQILKTARETTLKTPSSIDNLIHRHQSKDATDSGLKQLPAQAPKGISFLSFGKPLFNDTAKQMQLSSLPGRDKGSEMHHENNQIVLGRSQSPNETPCKTSASPLTSLCESPKHGTLDKPHSSDVPPWKTPASQVSFHEFPRAVAESQNKNSQTSSSAQKALLSTLAFASNYQAEMIDKSNQSSLTDDNKNGTRSGNSQSKSVQKGPMTASMILQEFLFGGSGNKKT